MAKKIFLSISFILFLVSCSTDPKTIIGSYTSTDGRLKMIVSDNGHVSFSSVYSTPEGSFENALATMSNAYLVPWKTSDVLYKGNYTATGIYGATNIYLDFDFDNKVDTIECDLTIDGELTQYNDIELIFIRKK